MYSYLARALVSLGTLIILAALLPVHRLVAQLPEGSERKHWQFMSGMVVAFVLGYLAFLSVTWNNLATLPDLLVPVIFLLGACFVWLVANLSLRTALALLRVRCLEQENLADPLTGAYNRRCLDRRLSEEVARASRHHLPLSILLLDIDHFKSINDLHGHQVGDQILAAFVEVAGRDLRGSDILARYGGDEFMIIAPHTSHSSAVDMAERLLSRSRSERFEVAPGQSELSLTCSIGVASFGPDLDNSERLIRCADHNLYCAKRAGRDRVKALEPATAVVPEPCPADG